MMNFILKRLSCMVLIVMTLLGTTATAVRFDENGDEIAEPGLLRKPYTDLPVDAEVVYDSSYSLELKVIGGGVLLTYSRDSAGDSAEREKEILFCRKSCGNKSFRVMRYIDNPDESEAAAGNPEELNSQSQVGKVIDRNCKNGKKYQYRVLYKAKDSEAVYYRTKTVTTYYLSMAQIESLSKCGNRKLRVHWEQNSEADGYEIAYSRHKDMKNAKTKTIRNGDRTKATLSGLKSGKTYYVEVSSYKTVNGKTYYSESSLTRHKKVS